MYLPILVEEFVPAGHFQHLVSPSPVSIYLGLVERMQDT